MPRIARVVAVGFPHHVTQRGNYQQPVFEESDDFAQYKSWLMEYSRKYGLEIWAYCLMSNHVHFVCVPKREDSLSRTFNTLHMRHSQYLNRRRGTKGHLWQGRFYSCILDERHLYGAVRYVENNPVRAGIVREALDYEWSSAKNHVKGEEDILLSGRCPLEDEIEDWKAYLKETEDKKVIEAIRKNSLSGRPCGDDGFIRKIEALLNRQLEARARGRPKKEVK
ncbi:MAG: transposase [Syntrophaceae bacterium]|nr:transposase [Syntrophaceae bacterium]